MNHKHYLAAALAATLSGCVTVPREQLDAADVGPVPDAEAIVKQWLATTLKDPESVKQLQVTPPEKCANRRASWKPEFGWCFKYQYNAKNSFGGYVGLTYHTMMVQGGKVLMHDGAFQDGWAAQM